MKLKFEEQIIHERRGDFLKVRNLRLFGTNEEIGFKLGEIAKKRHSISRIENLDTFKNLWQRKYLRNNYPVRREFTSMTGSTPKDHDSLNDKLENLGFKVTHG